MGRWTDTSQGAEERSEQRAVRGQPGMRVFSRTSPKVAFQFPRDPLSILITLSEATVLDVLSLCHISVTASHIFEAEGRKHVCYG